MDNNELDKMAEQAVRDILDAQNVTDAQNVADAQGAQEVSEVSAVPEAAETGETQVAAGKQSTALAKTRVASGAKAFAKSAFGAIGRTAKRAGTGLGNLAAAGITRVGKTGASIAKAGAKAASGVARSASEKSIKQVPGGVCAAQGFRASGMRAGIRAGKTDNDLALIVSDVPAAAASVHTTNRVIGAPNTVTRRHLANGVAQAIICNSGIANTCNADGIEVAEVTCDALGRALGIPAEDVVVASTGVIGQPLDVNIIANAIPQLVSEVGIEMPLALDETEDAAVSAEGAFTPQLTWKPLGDLVRHAGSLEAEHAIMTTDTVPKEVAVEFKLGGRTCHLGGIAKGSGMIHPNMATMLVFITTDVAIENGLLQEALSGDVASTFNMLSVDGDTSTNDMVVVLANGAAGNEPIVKRNRDFRTFMRALNTVTVALCRMIAADGEGATKLLECTVTGAHDVRTARTVAKSVVCSNLVKAAMFGADANWGRVLCAIGYSGADVDVNRIGVSFQSTGGTVEVCRAGAGIAFSEELAKKVLEADEINIQVSLASGNSTATAWGCDLTYEYVKINGDYRT